MSDRTYRLILGALLLVTLYFDIAYLMYFLIGLLFFEGVTNLRLPLLLRQPQEESAAVCNLEPIEHTSRFRLEAERAWRLIVGLMLLVTYVLFYDLLWFFPWFMGFAIFGAGASGVCPVLIGVKWTGCR
ncbi:MAG: DUF2892 domain-containing protein [Sulfuriferula multivorans]|uniref:DUF2892 domain-containing protein n=1 Tax=Sulfuriferula multivorans TaxID=1559896 RepID=A0A7C9P8H3_9PROT|nr:DUF2892 domain-containing protein [Sulfuriferula multivorans]